MSSFQYKFEKKKLDQSNAILEHYFGDLWIRDDVCFQDDLDKAFDNDIEPIIKNMSEIKSFDWKLFYTIPYMEQIKSKSEKKYKIKEDNKHYVEIISFENNTLYLCSELIINPPELIVSLIKKFKDVKKLYIDCANTSGGFLELEEDNDDYICQILDNPRWEVYMLTEEDPSDIEDLKKIKAAIDPSIKIDLNNPELESKI